MSVLLGIARECSTAPHGVLPLGRGVSRPGSPVARLPGGASPPGSPAPPLSPDVAYREKNVASGIKLVANGMRFVASQPEGILSLAKGTVPRERDVAYLSRGAVPPSYIATKSGDFATYASGKGASLSGKDARHVSLATYGGQFATSETRYVANGRSGPVIAQGMARMLNDLQRASPGLQLTSSGLRLASDVMSQSGSPLRHHGDGMQPKRRGGEWGAGWRGWPRPRQSERVWDRGEVWHASRKSL